jgi:hypothetical protein
MKTIFLVLIMFIFPFSLFVMDEERNMNKFREISVEVIESKLELEDWMINDNVWNVKPIVNLENEIPLEIEEWMINEKIWD